MHLFERKYPFQVFLKAYLPHGMLKLKDKGTLFKAFFNLRLFLINLFNLFLYLKVRIFEVILNIFINNR